MKLRIKEGTMSNFIVRNRGNNHNMCVESLKSLEIGNAYKYFYMISDHITDYDIDIENLKKGDIIVKEFEFGTINHGGDKGFIPVKVIEKYDDYTLLVSDGYYEYEIYYDPSSKSEKYHRLNKNVFNN